MTIENKKMTIAAKGFKKIYDIPQNQADFKTITGLSHTENISGYISYVSHIYNRLINKNVITAAHDLMAKIK
jgi:hypothetical protein